MSERIIINGEPVDVPPEIVSADGRTAVQAWHRQQLADRKVPHRVFKNGDAVEVPAAIASKSTREIDAWAADEEKRRTDPEAFAAELAARTKPAATSTTSTTAPAATSAPASAPASPSKE